MMDPEEIPRYLYRVFDDGSVSHPDPHRGFLAGSPNGAFDPSKHWARYVVERHMDWNNGTLTPFISTTDSAYKAMQYAEQRENWGHEGVYIATIDTDKMEEGYQIFHMLSLVEHLGAYILDLAVNDHEYLILHQIPCRAIVDISTLEECE
jgi:hypothetical protein